MSGHDHDYTRLRLLGLLVEWDIPASVADDFADVEKWLPVSQLLITYVAGPYPDAAQCRASDDVPAADGRHPSGTAFAFCCGYIRACWTRSVENRAHQPPDGAPTADPDRLLRPNMASATVSSPSSGRPPGWGRSSRCR